jgi:hypothetical protein
MEYQEVRDLIFTPKKYFITKIVLLTFALSRVLFKHSLSVLKTIFVFVSQKLEHRRNRI